MKANVFICSFFLIFTNVTTLAQVTNTTHTGAAGEWCGWDNLTGFDLNIENRGNNNINFITNTNVPPIIRMTIVGTAGGNNGFVGIGTTSPTRRLNVINDVDITPGPNTFPFHGYCWQDSVILKTNNISDNIFLGNNSGISAGGGNANTFLGASSGRMHSGNSGGNTFIGWNAGSQTINAAENVMIGSRAGQFDNGNDNCFIGVRSGNIGTFDSTYNNSFLGRGSGRANTGDDNVFIGLNSGANNTQNQNTFVGFSSGSANTTGRQNVFLGANSGDVNLGGSNLTFMGFNAGTNNINGANNTFGGASSGSANIGGNDLTFYGFESGLSNTGGINNTFMGSLAGRTTTTGNSNSFFGFQSGLSNNRGNDNTFMGIESGMSNINDSNNTFYGCFAGRALAAGSSNTFIGSQSGLTLTSADSVILVGAGSTAINGLTNAVVIGSNADVRNNNQMILGNNNINVGIGLSGNATGPTNKLEINAAGPNLSGLTFTQLRPTSPNGILSYGKVLTVDSSGVVVLTDDNGGNGSVTACSSVVADIGFITKWSTITTGGTREICKTDGIFEQTSSPYEVGIHQGNTNYSTSTEKYQLQLTGHMLISGYGGISMLNSSSGKDRMFFRFGSNPNECLAIGTNAGPTGLLTGSGNSAVNSIYIGKEAGKSTVTNGQNVFIGDYSGKLIPIASGNVNNHGTLIGYNTAVACTSAAFLTAVGSLAGSSLVSGNNNTFIGGNSGTSGLTAGTGNIIIGTSAIVFEPNGDDNIVIGNSAQVKNSVGSTGNVSNTVTIGSYGFANCSNCVTIAAQSGSSFSEQQVGIGVLNPTATIGATGGGPGGVAKLYVSDYAGSGVSAHFNGAVYTKWDPLESTCRHASLSIL